MKIRFFHAIEALWQGAVAIWQTIAWLRRLKKNLDVRADEYLTAQRAYALRLALEKTFHALETGKGLDRLPRVLRWLCGVTTVDNKFGWFGMRVLKSQKLDRNDPILDEPIDREVFTWRNPPK